MESLSKKAGGRLWSVTCFIKAKFTLVHFVVVFTGYAQIWCKWNFVCLYCQRFNIAFPIVCYFLNQIDPCGSVCIFFLELPAVVSTLGKLIVELSTFKLIRLALGAHSFYPIKKKEVSVVKG